MSGMIDPRCLTALPQKNEEPAVAKAPTLIGIIAQLPAQLRMS